MTRAAFNAFGLAGPQPDFRMPVCYAMGGQDIMGSRTSEAGLERLDSTQRILYEALAGTANFYRQQARRLLGLATSSPFQEVKSEFLDLAQRYDALADHAALKAHSVWPGMEHEPPASQRPASAAEAHTGADKPRRRPHF